MRAAAQAGGQRSAWRIWDALQLKGARFFTAVWHQLDTNFTQGTHGFRLVFAIASLVASLTINKWTMFALKKCALKKWEPGTAHCLQQGDYIKSCSLIDKGAKVIGLQQTVRGR